MALLVDERVPDHLLRPEVPLGVYWQIWNSDIGFQAKVELTTKAINKGWSVADAKDAMGDESTRTGGTYLKGRAERVDGDRLIVSGPEIEAAAKLVAGRELSIRVLKE
jgi:hypothetical protein